MKQNFKVKTLSAAIMSTFISMPLYAAETEKLSEVEVRRAAKEAKQQQAEIEVIEVTGFAGSLRKAMNAKRFSDGVSDSIHAEDVGKSTDQNIADALSRVTGISVQEEGGEGTRITVRGAGPSLNQISMNGVALTSGLSTDGSDANATNDNSVDLSSFSADVLSSIDVQKTASADQDEGSLGANIVLRTVRPLDLNKPRRSFTVEGRFNEFSDAIDSRLNFSVSDKFFDEKFGVVFTASKDKQKTRQDSIRTDWVDGAIPIVDAEAVGGRPAHDIATGKPIRVLGWQRDGEGDLLLDADGNRQLNDISTLSNYDPATQVLHEGDLYVAARDTVDFSLNTNIRERLSISTGLQFRPIDDINIQLDVTHTKQDIYTDNHLLRISMQADTPLIFAGDDNLALNGVDLATNTLAKSSSRSTAGGFTRDSGLREIQTDVATLAIDYDITDNLTVDLTLGYSRTNDETPDLTDDDRFIRMGTATWGTAGRVISEAQPAEILELIGYDCSTGRNCSYATGETPAQFDAFDSSAISVPSRFNPFDLQHNHLGSLTFRKNASEDINKSVFVNFDYALDNDYITSLEFGGKWTKRSRDINIQNIATTNGEDVIDLDDPDADFTPAGLGSIRVANILSDSAFPYDNFAEGIQNDRSNPFFGGWPLLDSTKAIEILSGKPANEVGLRGNNLGTRYIETETNAAYAKVNFELLDGRLTGNIGTRYVKDDKYARGIGGINYNQRPHFIDPYDLIVDRNFADMSQDACPAGVFEDATRAGPQRWQPGNVEEFQNCWAWQVTHAYDYTKPETFPIDENGDWQIPGADGLTGPDVNRVVFFENGQLNNITAIPEQIFTSTGGTTATSQQTWAHFAQAGQIWPYIDRTTSTFGPLGRSTDIQLRTAIVEDSHSTDLWLPSLNLNYQVNDDTILRFGVSKTMTRPRVDSLNPRVSINEQNYVAATGSAGNTALLPLESKNIDLSYEWYFNDSGLLSVALFSKDMINFEEQANIRYHYQDKRTEYDLQSADLLLPFDASRQVGDAEDCHPLRQYAGFFTEWLIECDVANINQVRNGAGATIRGLEFGYTQTYDFLPGAFSALGLSFNYTYQNSESEEEIVNGTLLKPLPQAYTPEHSANTTLFWEKDDIQLRLAHRYTGTQMVNRGLQGGASWQDATSRLDFSSSYKINENISITFQALNLTDDTRRLFYTASEGINVFDNNSEEIVLDEGDVFDGNVTEERTLSEFKTGRQFRLGVRGTF